jgi:hypothetical protein
MYVDGIGLWAAGLPNLAALRDCLRGDPALTDAPAKPAPGMLAAAEKRRAPDSVLLALEAATQACSAAARDPRELPSVFTCTYGDLAITDHMCSTLASAPTQLSPTKFHNSVHNAAAGYWGIASGSTTPTTALSAGPHSFAAGLLEAAMQLLADNDSVLLVAYDIASPAMLNQVASSSALFGAALVLSNRRSAQSVASIALFIEHGAPPASAIFSSSLLQQLYTSNPMASCLPLFVALAGAPQTSVILSVGAELLLRMEISECPI